MESGRKRLSSYFKPIIIIAAGLLLVSAASALTTLNIPSQVISAQAAVTTSACSGTLLLTGSPSPGTGTLRYNCSASSGAFAVSQAGSDTPTFNPPSEISAVGYVSHSASSCSGFTSLTSGASTTLAAPGDFDICANYSCPTGCSIPAWSFSWQS